MTTNEEHISMFELDLYFAAQATDARIEEHVAACDSCGGYLVELAVLQGQTSVPLPAPRPGASSVAWRSRPRALGLTLAAGLAVLGAVTALLVVSRDVEPPVVAIKGTPAVQLLVRRGDVTRPWDGASPVRPGDVLGLRLACEELEHVAVVARSAEPQRRWSPMYQGGCPPVGAALPFTLVVDDQPGVERFAVVFSAAPLEPAALDDAVERRRTDGSAWVTRFELGKEIAR
jgi:hypothetical protein